MAGELWVARHGETEWSAAGRHTGRTDVPLTDVGHRQALALQPMLSAHRFALVLASPLQRARATAEDAGFAAAESDDDLAEWDYGDYEGRTTAEIRRDRPGWVVWRDGCPGGESIDSLGARTDRVIARARSVDGDTLVFAHGHLLRVLAARWIGLPPADGALLGLDPAGIGVLGWEREQPVVRRWNLG